MATRIGGQEIGVPWNIEGIRERSQCQALVLELWLYEINVKGIWKEKMRERERDRDRDRDTWSSGYEWLRWGGVEAEKT